LGAHIERTRIPPTIEMKLDQLSRAECEVYERIIRGDSNTEAARYLHIDIKTVKFHLTHIFKKIGVTSRSKLIVRHYQREIAKLKGTGKRFIYDE